MSDLKYLRSHKPTNVCWYGDCDTNTDITVPLFGGLYSICFSHKLLTGLFTEAELADREALNNTSKEV